MVVVKNLYYVLFIALIGSFFVIIANSSHSVPKNAPEVAQVVHPSFFQENQNFLVVTGRRELNGFKGYRHYRRGYRKHSDNWWYPERVFIEAEHMDAERALLKEKSAASKTLRASSLKEKEPWMSKQHIASCVARYRSYNQKDNSYQPFNGPRRQCFSRFFKEQRMLKSKEF